MKAYLALVTTNLVFASACGPGFDAEGTDGADSVVSDAEQTLGEAACGTTTVNATLSYHGNTVLFPTRKAPYGSAACPKADVIGFVSDKPRSGFVDASQSVAKVSAADCAKTKFHAVYYKNGAPVADVTGTGVLSGPTQSTRCIASVSFSFIPNGTTTRVQQTSSGPRVLVAGSTPVASDNARFVFQGTRVLADGSTALVNYDIAFGQ